MRITRLGPLVAFGFLFFATSIQAQQSSTSASRDPQATALLQHSLAALVGNTALKDITLDASANWIAGSDNETGSATLKATAIGQGRIDLSLSDGQRSEVIDITQIPPVGNWCGIDGTWHAMEAHNLFTDPTWFFPTFLIGRVLSGASYAISPMDSETQGGVAVEHLTVYQQPAFTTQGTPTLQSLSQIDIYVNSSTFLPVSISFNTHADTNALVNVPIQINFSSYQQMQGIWVPSHVQKYINNGLVLDLTVSSIQINTGLSASDFQVQ